SPFFHPFVFLSLMLCCRLSYQRNDDDEEEAARERRRRARQERLRQKEEGDLSGEVMEKSEVNAQNSVAEEETKRTTTTGGTDDEAALLERLARREERRQKRLQEALERQKEFDPTITDGSLSPPSRKEVNNVEENETTGKEEKAETRRGRYDIEETETVTKSYQRNNWRQDGEEEEKKEEKDKEEVQEEKPKEVPVEENQVDVTAEKSTHKEEVVETKNIAINAEEHKAENYTNAVLEGEQSITDAVNEEELRDEEKAEEERKKAEEGEKLEAEERERLKAEEEKKATEEKQKAEEEKRAAEERERAKAEEEKRAAEERERAKAEEEKRAAEERARAKAEEEKRAAEERARAKAEEEKRAAEEKAKLEAEKLKEKQKMEEKKIEDKQVKEKKVQEEKPQAAFLRKQQVKDDKDKGKAPKEEMKSIWDRKKGVPEQKAQNGERELTAPKLKSTENAFGRSSLKGTTNAEEEFEKLKEKQQEAAAELDELKKRREERRKILEEEEQKKKQEEAERKAREEEEKRRMKEEIERRRAEAAEKRQKMPEDGLSEDKKPFKCFSPKGSSLKIEERAEFLNKSAQKSGMKPTHTTAVVSKIDSRLEQYTSAIEGTKAARPTKPAASDLPVPAEGVRNIKSMWEKGNVFSSPSGTGTPNKETAGLKVGVSSRINEWLTKTPDSNKSPAPKPSDLKPGDVSSKRNLWEKQSVEKPAASSKVSAMGKKSETNGK
uniref:Caldesmon 1 n=1 Tax=Strix occidentalis caurina TaxID=311401 RepID=A0A8D0G2I8_STROC